MYAHVHTTTLADAHRAFSEPISTFWIPHTPSTHTHTPSAHLVRASTLVDAHSHPFPAFPLHPRPTHICASTLPHANPFPGFLRLKKQLRASTLAHAHRSFSPPMSTLSLPPALFAYVLAPTLADAHWGFSPSFAPLPLHSHCPRTSTQPLSLMLTGPFPIHCHPCPWTHGRPHMSAHTTLAHIRTGPSADPFPPSLFHPHRPHTSAHPRLLFLFCGTGTAVKRCAQVSCWQGRLR